MFTTQLENFKHNHYTDGTLYFAFPYVHEFLNNNIREEVLSYSFDSSGEFVNQFEMSSYPFVVYPEDLVKDIPEYEGIYIIGDNLKPLYIGATTNLKTRLLGDSVRLNLGSIQKRFFETFDVDKSLTVRHQKMTENDKLYFFRVLAGDTFAFEKHLISRYPTPLNIQHTKNRSFYEYRVIEVSSEIADNDLSLSNLKTVVSKFPLARGNQCYIIQDNVEDLIEVEGIHEKQIALRIRAV